MFIQIVRTVDPTFLKPENSGFTRMNETLKKEIIVSKII